MLRLASLLTAVLLIAPTNVDLEGKDSVQRAVQDYVQALYETKPELLERSVHPALVKRGTWRPDDSNEYRTPTVMTYEQLFELAGYWNKDGQQGKELEYSIEVHDVMDMTASAMLSAKWGVDHMQLLKQKDGTWKIVHILWQSHPPKQTAEAGAGR